MLRNIQRMSHLRPCIYRSISIDTRYPDLGLYRDDHYGIWISGIYKFGGVMEVMDQAVNLLGISSLFNGVGQKIEEEINEILGKDTKIDEYVHRFGERGIFLCFQDPNARDFAIKQLEQADSIGSCKSFRCYPVKGIPYIEDLFFRTRSTKLSIKNLDKTLTEEEIFDLFRPYGKILEIEFSGSSAEIHYFQKRSAMDARCCIHRYFQDDDGKKTNPIYVEFLKHHRIRVLFGYLKSPKLLPIFILLITFLLIILVEPIRLFNCCKTLSQTKSKKVRYTDEEYKQKMEAFRLSLDTTVPSFFVITGCKGSGKSSFVNGAINNRRLTTKIDFSDVKTPREVINVFEKSISYRPSFRTWNSIVRSIESLIPGSNTISNSEEQQLDRILRTMEISLGLAKVVAKDRKAVLVFDSVDKLGLKSGTELNKMMSQVLSWCQKIEEKGLAHIVFVCNHNFVKYHLQRSQSLGNRIKEVRVPSLPEHLILKMVLDRRNEYVVGVAQNSKKIKKLRFIKFLTSYFKDRKEQRKKAKKKNQQKIVNGEEEEELRDRENRRYGRIDAEEFQEWKEVTKRVGGSDLGLLLELVRRTGAENNGSVMLAYKQLKQEIKDEVITRGFGKKMFEEEDGMGWSKIVLWKVMNKLVELEGEVKYDDLLLKVFYGKSCEMRALVEAKLLCLSKKKGGMVVTPYNHVVGEVFQEMVKDERLISRMKEFEERLIFEKNLEIAAKVGRSCTIL